MVTVTGAHRGTSWAALTSIGRFSCLVCTAIMSLVNPGRPEAARCVCGPGCRASCGSWSPRGDPGVLALAAPPAGTRVLPIALARL